MCGLDVRLLHAIKQMWQKREKTFMLHKAMERIIYIWERERIFYGLYRSDALQAEDRWTERNLVSA